MKKLLMFFIGFGLLILAFVIMYFASALFNASNTGSVSAVIFQPNNLSKNRIEKPINAEQLSDNLQEKLIKKYITEYFYVIPDSENITRRTRGDSVLAALSAPAVFRDWQKNYAGQMLNLANNKILRNVKIENEILKQGDYWLVYYELKTWDKPNIMNATPEIDKGMIYLKIRFEPGLRDTRGGQKFDIQNYIENGGDPAALFKFEVQEIKI